MLRLRGESARFALALLGFAYSKSFPGATAAGENSLPVSAGNRTALRSVLVAKILDYLLDKTLWGR